MVPVVTSFQKNTQSVDIMLKIETQKKEALLLKVFSFFTKICTNTSQMKIFQSWCEIQKKIHFQFCFLLEE